MNVSGNLENILIELFFSWLLREFEASKLLFWNAKSHGLREPAASSAEVAGHGRSLLSREASTGRDRAV